MLNQHDLANLINGFGAGFLIVAYILWTNSKIKNKPFCILNGIGGFLIGISAALTDLKPQVLMEVFFVLASIHGFYKKEN
jgi:hypothetical protein